MLPTTKPRSSTPRATHTPSASLSFAQPSSSSHLPSSSTHSLKPSRSRGSSLSSTMHWLSRSSTQNSSNSTPYAPSKPTKISEPKVVRQIELLSQRSGVLGAGATVVRTPDEALRETGVRLTYDGSTKPLARVDSKRSRSVENILEETVEQVRAPYSRDDYLSPPNSPPLPPLPPPQEDEEQELDAESIKRPPRPTRAPPTPPPMASAPSLRPSLKPRSQRSTEDFPTVPGIPTYVSVVPSPPPFKPILISTLPSGENVDPSKVIVTVETCTSSFKTTLETIQSRPSHLSSYISSLLPRVRTESIASSSSVYSTASAQADMSAYRRHLASQGLLSSASYSIHIFLDRPSAPYAHILHYLRSPLGTPDSPELLPRSIQLQSSSHARLEMLLELRDEASFLGLQDLYKLCVDQIRLRSAPCAHTRNPSANPPESVHSLHGSIHSLHALLERVESDIRSQRDSHDGKRRSEDSHEAIPARSPPTPQSWNGRSRSRSTSRPPPPAKPAPAGWI
ncbi:hypothetical protein BDN72DRAFT_885377 [Pluteus cervinus]|uniref:Uncharacterized protein n=1 Tax=Pluteus cervinus TaxID=181527 RepID=A0ACD3BCP7_9AGAR|nr:hypothetical protein BDN72DRAFT_885377 [Pluteus cervinus]